jgi:hypothetical protein
MQSQNEHGMMIKKRMPTHAMDIKLYLQCINTHNHVQPKQAERHL